MKKNLWFLISSFLVLILVIIVPFLFTNEFASDGTLAVYLVSKILCILLLIGAIIYCFFKETSNGMILSLTTLNSFFQFIPLAQRLILQSNVQNSVVWGVLVLVLSLLIYIVFAGLILTSNKKMVKANHSYEGKEIEVKEASTFAHTKKEAEND